MRIIITFLLFIASLNAYCSETIKIDKKYDSDDVIDLTSYQFEIYGVQLFGDVDLTTDSSLVRTVFFGTGNEIAMLNEFYYPLYLNGQYQLSFSEENILLGNGVYPEEIAIYINDASLQLDSITLFESEKELLQYDSTSYDFKIKQKIFQLNSNLELEGYIWRSDATVWKDKMISRNYDYFGHNSYAYEYYAYGIYSSFVPDTREYLNSAFINHWDWRNRHGATDSLSAYWDGDTDAYFEYAIWDSIHEQGNGWMTRIHCQRSNYGAPYERCGNGCFLFSPVNAVEARMNLYYNQHLDYDLSEQDVMECNPYSNRTCYNGGFVSQALRYIRDYGVVNESCFTYINDTCSCSEKCINPEDKVQIGDYQSVIYANDIDSLRKRLIDNGPMTFGYNNHATCLVGYGTIYPNMVLDGDNSWGYVIIDEDSPFVGMNYWILKNSRTARDSHDGYIYGLHEENTYTQYII